MVGSVYATFGLIALARALPAPQVSGYTDADAPYNTDATSMGPTASTFGPDSQIPAIATSAPATGTGAAPPRVTSDLTGHTSHGPYSGTPTTTGAETAPGTVGTAIPILPPNPTATYYNADGKLQQPAPVPYQPAGGLGTNGTEPRYMVESDFDFESIALGTYQEYIELDLFNNGLATFSAEDFLEAGLNAEERALIAFFAVQESGHATLLSNMLGEAAPKQCTYDYPFKTVREFLEFNALVTAWGEAGVWGFINHLDSREVGQLLAQSIATEARQAFTFRQMMGLQPVPVWFETGIPQSWSWTYLAPYISSCPENNTRLVWQNFPALHVVNQANPNRVSANDTADWEVVGNRTSDPAKSDIPSEESCVNLNVTGYSCGPAISRNRTEPLTFPGRKVFFEWDAPGQAVGPNNSYVTSTSAGEPKFVAWVSQLNLTYTPLEVTGGNTGFTYQPASEVYQGDAGVNQTTFIALTDTDEYLSAFNLSMINPHVAALGLYKAG